LRAPTEELARTSWWGWQKPLRWKWVSFYASRLRAGDAGTELAEHLKWFKDVVDDYLSLRTLVK
jgi:hypothetical protein